MKNMENHIILGDLALENVEALAQGKAVVRVELVLVTVIYKVMEEQLVVIKFIVIDKPVMVKSIHVLQSQWDRILNQQEIDVLNN